MDVDVAVIGASSAGLYAAEQLARRGRKVTVFERQPALNHARRTLIITPQLVRVLGDLPEHVILHRTPIIEVVSAGAATRVCLDDPDLIVERHALIEHLAERATQAGAQILFDHRFKGMDATTDGAMLSFHRRDGDMCTVRAGAVIGADGVFSSVATAAGLVLPPLVQIIQAEVQIPSAWDPQVTRVWFDADATRYFYWFVPESDTHGVLGVIAEEDNNTRELLERFLVRQGLQPLAYQASHVAMYHPRLRPWGALGSTPVFLVGDAAGQVKVTTVGGTVSGLYGAEAVVAALLQPARTRAALRAMRRELDLHWWIRVFLERLDNAGYDCLIANITPAVQDFLGRRNRDVMAGGIWRLPFLRPQLVALGLAALRPRRRPYAQVRLEPQPDSESKPS